MDGHGIQGAFPDAPPVRGAMCTGKENPRTVASQQFEGFTPCARGELKDI
jgi:hypothetical protein